jgi:diguanylate cyclase (GGDEF)-like protein
MPHVVEHLAELTAFRDRDVLDVTLAVGLRDLLRPLGVVIARCVGEPGQQRWMVRARLMAGDSVASSDASWTELETLPELATHDDRSQCLHSRHAHVVPGAVTVSYFPLITEREAIGVLEVHSALALSTEQLRMVSSILRLYGNFQSLLDYGERDTLTGLLNRKTFEESFMRMTARPEAALASDYAGGQRQERPEAGFWLGVLDIDHFKRVNDNFGHLIGDEVLLLMSRLMRNSFRYQDQLFRFGGEEFVVLMRCADAEAAGRAIERLRLNVECYAFPQVGRITVSVGFTELRPSDTPAAAFERADKAVYYAKQNGRNQVHHHAELVASGKLADESRDSKVELF